MELVRDIKPCPFCNGDAKLFELATGLDAKKFDRSIRCITKKCEARIPYEQRTREEMILVWNTRTK